ncbi:MAG TPA: oxidoreductase [Pasteurellaceae bacterium]|nr:oxidoreductase [Pasteurellaceae bacterium]
MVKQAVITGVSSGIGKAIAQILLANGWSVIGLSRTAPNITDSGLLFHSIDLTDSEALKQYLTRIASVDAIIHAAGAMIAGDIGGLDEHKSLPLWQLNVHAAEVLVNTLVHKMTRGGRIILIGSRTSRGVISRSQYTATKAALVAMARSWAAELIPRGITVNIIAPRATDTPMLKDPARKNTKPKCPPIGRYILPEEVANYANYLLSPWADAITGQELVICGGASLSST